MKKHPPASRNTPKKITSATVDEVRKEALSVALTLLKRASDKTIAPHEAETLARASAVAAELAGV